MPRSCSTTGRHWPSASVHSTAAGATTSPGLYRAAWAGNCELLQARSWVVRSYSLRLKRCALLIATASNDGGTGARDLVGTSDRAAQHAAGSRAAPKSGIGIVFVDGLASQVGNPGLDVPGRNKTPPSVGRRRLVAFDRGASTCSTRSATARRSASMTTISACSTRCCEPGSRQVPSQTARTNCSRNRAFRTDFDPLNPQTLARLLRKRRAKPPQLPVFTQDNHVNVAAHDSHPLAITSDSFSPPSTANSLAGRTTVAPELSRFSTNPRSPPR